MFKFLGCGWSHKQGMCSSCITVIGADGQREQYPSFVPFFVLLTVSTNDASPPACCLRCRLNLSFLPYLRSLAAQHLAVHIHLFCTVEYLFCATVRMWLAYSRTFALISLYPAYPPTPYASYCHETWKYGVCRARLVLFATTSSTNASRPSLPCLPYCSYWSVSWKWDSFTASPGLPSYI